MTGVMVLRLQFNIQEFVPTERTILSGPSCLCRQGRKFIHNDRLALLLVIVSSPFSPTASLRIRARSSLSPDPFHPLLKFLFQEQVGESGTESRPAAVFGQKLIHYSKLMLHIESCTAFICKCIKPSQIKIPP